MVKFVVRVFILDVNSWGRIFCVAWQIFDPEKVAWLYSKVFEARAKSMDALGRWANLVNSKLDQIMGYETAFFMLLLPSLRSEYRSPSFALPSLLIGFQNFEASVKMLVWVFYPLGLITKSLTNHWKKIVKMALQFFQFWTWDKLRNLIQALDVK